MALSLILMKFGDELFLQTGGWENKQEAEEWVRKTLSSEERFIAFETVTELEDCPNAAILEAILSSGAEHSLGRDLEALLNFAFRLGQKAAR